MTRGWGTAPIVRRVMRAWWMVVPVLVVIAGLHIGTARSATQAETKKEQEKAWKQSLDAPGWDGQLDFRVSPDGGKLWILRPGRKPWAAIMDRTTRNVLEVPGQWADVEGRAC